MANIGAVILLLGNVRVAPAGTVSPPPAVNNAPVGKVKPELAVISPDALIVPVEILPKLPVIDGDVIVGVFKVGDVRVGEVAKTNSPVPVEVATLAEVSKPHSLAVAEVAWSTFPETVGVV